MSSPRPKQAPPKPWDDPGPLDWLGNVRTWWEDGLGPPSSRSVVVRPDDLRRLLAAAEALRELVALRESAMHDSSRIDEWTAAWERARVADRGGA